MSRTWWIYPTRRFSIDGIRFGARIRARSDGLYSQLVRGTDVVAEDRTPLLGPESVRNHRLDALLPDGRALAVEAGYVSMLTTGIIVRVDGTVVHESHPGRTVAYPEKYREMAVNSKHATLGEAVKEGWREGADQSGYDMGVWKRNRVPLAVDVALGLLFFVVAKLTDLPTAALAGAGVGLALVVVQRFVKVDLLGGLAMFGIVMLLISAGLSIAFQDDDAVKLRTTIVGLISATLFLGDGLLGGRHLGARMARYLPYTDIQPHRLAIGMGVLGIVMAGLNWAVARLVSTDLWLLYTTFGDFILFMGLIMIVFSYARGQLLPARSSSSSGELAS